LRFGLASLILAFSILSMACAELVSVSEIN
jgi:hypothetical protein